MSDVRDRAKGCFFGLFCGDALGATLEFTARDTQPVVTEMVGGGLFELEPGCWTDDGAMALAMTESLCDEGRFNPIDVMERWIWWYRFGYYSSNGKCFDIGNATRAAIDKACAYAHRNPKILKCAIPRADGNGTIMRLAPLPIFRAQDATFTRLKDEARTQSRLTHGGKVATQCAEDLARILWSLIRGEEDFAHVLESVYRPGDLNLDRSDVHSTGYADDTLHAALWSVWNSGSAEEAITVAVNLGGDSDTVGAVTGQIAGAMYGYSTLPKRWVSKLARFTYLEATFDQLWEAAQRS